MKRFLTLFLAALLVAGLCAGCGKKPQETQEYTEPVAEEEEKNIKIGLSFDSFVIERWLRDRDAFVAAADKLGAEVNVQNANGDVEEQIEQIRYLIKKQVDVLAVVAADCMAPVSYTHLDVYKRQVQNLSDYSVLSIILCILSPIVYHTYT